MASDDTKDELLPAAPGHVISDTTRRRIGYQLLCAVYAEYEWRTLRRDDDPDVLDELLVDSGTDITESLVALASLARAADDATEILTYVGMEFPHGVGVLRSGGKEQPLTPREACNKVMHARTMRWDLATSETNPLYERYYQRHGWAVRGSFKAPRFLFSGERGGQAWEADLEVVPFIIATACADAWQWKFA